MSSAPLPTAASEAAPIVCLSHLRWNFVYQRPQHLMSRFARRRRVWFVEEPVPTAGPAEVERHEVAPQVVVLVPRLPPEQCRPGDEAGEAVLRPLLAEALAAEWQRHGLDRAEPILWFYTAMALRWVDGLPARARVYDCMDELSAFRFAPQALRQREDELLARADAVFAGGRSLHEAKRRRHPGTRLFPSSVDAAHFATARTVTEDPADMAAIGRPRIGWHGVIDERIDLELLARVAADEPDWHFVLLGPVVKIDPALLPRSPNLHYLGPRPYERLPQYLGGWDVAMMPFALNEATRYISPTKTPEYLAGGCPVASTPVRDVVADWGASGLVHFGEGAEGFRRAIATALRQVARSASVNRCADELLRDRSWDRTVGEMEALLDRLPYAPTQRAALGRSLRVAADPTHAGASADEGHAGGTNDTVPPETPLTASLR